MASFDEAGFRDFVASGDEDTFVRHNLFDDSCWLFENETLLAPGSDYPSLKRDLSDLLRILPRDIAIVGSSKYGWSMSPKKGVKAFDPVNSDADIAIVSRQIFDESWRALREAYYAGYSHYKNKHAYHVFARALVLDGAEKYRSNYLIELAKKLANLNSIVQKHVRLEKPAQYRIYADWDDAINYHTFGLSEFRRLCLNGNA